MESPLTTGNSIRAILGLVVEALVTIVIWLHIHPICNDLPQSAFESRILRNLPYRDRTESTITISLDFYWLTPRRESKGTQIRIKHLSFDYTVALIITLYPYAVPFVMLYPRARRGRGSVVKSERRK